MAASSSSSGARAVAWADDIIRDSPYRDETYQSPTRSNSAQGEVASPLADKTLEASFDAFTLQSDTPPPYIEHGGKLGSCDVVFQRLQKLMNDEPWHRSFHFRTLAVRHQSVIILL
jgi:hypothetical protein